jgi:N-acetylmuramoyl-L-alanine amidase
MSVRLYTPIYLNAKAYPEAYGRPIYSNHWRDGHPVFYGYHWLVRRDGTTEHLLDDNRIGWHAGNWDINCSAVGLCLAGDYSSTPPPEQALQSLRRLIQQYNGAKVLLHSSVNPKSTCPGNWATDLQW